MGCLSGIVGEAGHESAQAFVAGPSPADTAGFLALVCDGSDAGLRSEMILALAAGMPVAQPAGDLAGADFPPSGEGSYEASFRQSSNGMLVAAGELGDLGDEAFACAGTDAREFALGVSLCDGWVGRGAEPAKHIGDAASAAILVLGEEGGNALLSQAVGACRRRVALDESPRDGACEQVERTWSMAFEQGAELSGEHDLSGNEIIAAAYQRAQGLNSVRLWPGRRQPVALGRQNVDVDLGVAGVAAGGDAAAIAGPARLDDSGVEQGVDEPTGPLDGGRRLAGRAAPAQGRNEIGKPVPFVSDGKVAEAPAGRVDDTNGMARSAPIDTNENGHGCTYANWSLVPGAGSCPHRVLINRRCGHILVEVSVAHLPVARLELPATATPQTSFGPSWGKQRRSSRRRGTNAQSALERIQRNREAA
ncbi:hypothetical protein ACVJBD_000093 [Rhizobium mongolense]